MPAQHGKQQKGLGPQPDPYQLGRTPLKPDGVVPDTADPAAGDAEAYLSQRELIWRRFKRSRMGLIGGVTLLLMYLVVLCAEFVAPYHYTTGFDRYVHAPPQRVRFRGEDGFHLRPFVYDLKMTKDELGLLRTYRVDPETPVPIRFFAKGEPYQLWGLIRWDRHLFGSTDRPVFILGTDRMGRDLFSRIVYGARISMTIGLVGVLLSILLGSLLGTVSGYYGGAVDTLMQRGIELLSSFPSIPLWMALAAAMPPEWSSVKVYFGITVILSLLGWGGLARQIRGMVLSYREQDFVMAARAAGAGNWHIIVRHLLPGCYSHMIVIATLAVPGMILGETALSFLGLGIRPPMTSWGVLLEEAQHLRVITQYPWLVLPAVPVILAVLAFNFVGDALRDAADPYAN